MKLKPREDRAASVRHGECIVDGCARRIKSFGFCGECLAGLNKTLERGFLSPPPWRGRGEPTNELEVNVVECTCYRDCADDSMSGSWHQHGDDPCPVHPDAPVVS